MKPWKAAKSFTEKYPKWDNIPSDVQAFGIYMASTGFLIGGGLMLLILAILSR